MSTPEELLNLVAEVIDEDTAAKLQAAIDQARADAVAEARAEATWKATLRSDAMYEKYPRMVGAIRMGVEDDPPSEEALAKMEEKLTKLGVADPRAAAAPAAPSPEPAAAWGSPLEAGSSPPPNIDAEVAGAMEKGDLHSILQGIHQGGKAGEGAYRDVVEPYQDWAPLPYKRYPGR